MSLKNSGHYSPLVKFQPKFDICVIGGGFIPLLTQIRKIICNHYWDSYKAITG